MSWEFKPIEWYHFPAEVEEGKGLCIFCNTVATHMRRESPDGQWQALCEEHKDSTEER